MVNRDNRNDKKKIALVILAVPGLPGKSGGEIRDAHFFNYLALNHKVDIFSISSFDINDLRYEGLKQYFNNIYCPQVIYKDYPEYIDKSLKYDFINKITRKFAKAEIYFPNNKYPLEIEGFFYSFNYYIKGFLQEKILLEEYDLIIATPQVNPVFLSDLSIPEKSKCIFATYDVEKIRHERLQRTQKTFWGKCTFRFEIQKAYHFEKRLLEKVDGIIAVSELDKEAFTSCYSFEQDRVLTIENGVDTEYFCDLSNHNKKGRDIVYIGNMGYAPNSQAVEYFLKNIFPIIKLEVPNARFWAVGANATPSLKKFDNGSDIIITGEVPDVREYLRKADVVCVPLITGSGTKYKVLEALSAKKAVVTTTIGAEGIDLTDGVHLMIKDTPTDFAQAVIDCLNEYGIRNELGINGRKFVISNHDWKIILPKLASWLDYICDNGIIRK